MRDAPGPLPGLPTTLEYPDVPVHAILEGTARRFPDRVAIHHGDEAVTYSELEHHSSVFARALRVAGAQPGDVVALHLPNGVAFATAYFGALKAGCTFSPANPLLPADDLAFQLADCGATTVVTSDLGAPALERARPDLDALRTVVHAGLRPAGNSVPLADMLSGPPESSPPTVDPRTALAHIAYTGGTTGRSKGVELTHRNVVANVVQYACWLHGCVPGLDADRGLRLDQVGAPEQWPVRLGTAVAIVLAPWFHAMGCIGTMAIPFAVGATLVLHDRFEPARFLADAEHHRVTQLSGAPAFYAALLAHPDFATRDLSSVRTVGAGAAPLSVAHVEALVRRLPDAVISEGYGLTEATMGVTQSPVARSSVRKVGSVGLPLLDTELRLVDPDTRREAATGEAGEVHVRGPQVMRGYLGREEETAAVLQDGWLRTGDIGVRDEDGFVRIVDRTKDMLIYKGYNVYPREIEELLVARPEVHAAAVVGRRDDDAGELPVGFVVPASGEAVDGERLRGEINDQLTPYKRLREVHVVDALPMSAAGKVLKRELRDRLG